MKNSTYLSIPRLVVTLIILQLGFLVLISKLFTLQFLDDETTMTSRQDWRSQGELVVKRGKILDRHGRVLGISQDRLAVCADPRTLNRKSNAHSVATELAPLLDATTSELLAQLKRKRNGEYVEFVRLKKGIDYEKLDAIRNITEKHRGLKIEVEPNRVYPKKTLASQVIGYLNDLDMGEGIEFQYDTYLQKLHSPKPQRKSEFTSVSLQAQPVSEPLGNNGCNVFLTIDEIIQEIAETELEQGCKDWNAPKGTAIVLSVETSEILAMASCPTYDINDQTNADEDAKRNLGIWYVFEPGSIFKIVASSAVLNEGIMTAESTVFCEFGRYRLPNRRVIKDVSAKGDLSLTEVLHKSSNIGMIKIVQKLGPELFQTYVDRYGFGEKTGIDLPYEQRGSLHTLRRWDTNSLGSVPFGQGISVTPLQMVNALVVIANGGVLRRPFITKEIRDAQGNLIKKNHPTEIRRVLRPEIANQMTDILVGVIEKGSGRKAKIEGVSVAGKTGTAQKSEKGKGYAAGKEVMSFMGFLPADDPKIAIIVTIDEPTGARFSGQIAGPVFKRIAMRTLQYIEQTDFFDSVPTNRRKPNSKYVTGKPSATTVVGVPKSNPSPNKGTVSPTSKGTVSPTRERVGETAKESSEKSNHSLIKSSPFSDNTLVKKGEGL